MMINPVRLSGLWAFPAIGLLIGGIGGGVLALAASVGLTREIGSLCAMAATILATGALHEDGLADFSDGIGGGRTRERKLEIMRDSRLGSYGAIALVIGLAWRWTALSAFQNVSDAILALIIAETGSRAIMLMPLLLPPARADGLGVMLAGMTSRHLLVTSIMPVALTILAYQALAIAPILAAVAAGAVITLIARRSIGGFTGDALGAAQAVSATLILTSVLRLAS
jgi:adenosylcobinamide-GDP ribazoletransferase